MPHEESRHNILFVLSGLEQGGTEIRLLAMARRMPRDIAVHMCVTMASVPLRPEFERSGAVVTVIPIARPWFAWRELSLIARNVRRDRIDVINTFDLKGILVALAVRFINGRQFRWAHHLVDLEQGGTRRRRALVRSLMRRADVLICDARSIRDIAIGTRPVRSPVEIIPNGVDTAFFAPDLALRQASRGTIGFDADHVVIGIVAKFRPEKNHQLLIHAFSTLHAENPALRLVCVGGGPLLDEMRTLVATLGIEGAVVFTGPVDDVRPFLAAMDVFVLSSLFDALSNAVLQAMAMGVPCVCSRTGDHIEIMDGDRAGLLFDPTDRADCVHAIRRVLTDDALRARLSTAGRALVESNHSIEVMVTRYVSLFRALSSRPAAADPGDD